MVDIFMYVPFQVMIKGLGQRENNAYLVKCHVRTGVYLMFCSVAFCRQGDLLVDKLSVKQAVNAPNKLIVKGVGVL